MITFKQYLEEARMAPLYHGTRMERAQRIMRENVLYGNSYNGLLQSRAVSLTRNFIFALNWGDLASNNQAVVLEFDQLKLSQRYKITPFNYFGRPARLYPTEKTYLKGKDFVFDNQFEESIPGAIKNVMRYVTKIHVYDEKHIPEEVFEYPHVEVWSYQTRKRIK